MPTSSSSSFGLCWGQLSLRPRHRVWQRYALQLRGWFAVGSAAVVVLSCLTVPCLAATLTTAVSPLSSTAGEDERPWVALALPGKTVPLSEAPALWLALAVSLTWHEVGHAAAATAEGVGVVSAGIGMVLLVLPSAFVELDKGALAALPPSRALRVHAAGPWHNLVLCAAVWVALSWWLSFGLSVVGYSSSAGGVTALSGHGPTGLVRGDLVVGVGNCTVTSVVDWWRCLGELGRAGAPAAAMVVAGGEGRASTYLQAEELWDLSTKVEVSDYRQVRGPVPLPPGLPSAVERGLRYTWGMSGGLALINAAPVYGLDGEEIARAMLALALSWRRRSRPRPPLGPPGYGVQGGGGWMRALLSGGTVLLAAAVGATWARGVGLLQ